MKIIARICLLIFLLSPCAVYSQGFHEVEKGFEMQEVYKMLEMYKSAPNLSFDFIYKYADSANSSVIIDSLKGSSKMSEGRYYTIIDSTEFIQGYQYNLTVFHRDSAIIVNDRQEYIDIMRLPLLDSIFMATNVDSVHLIAFDLSSTNWLILNMSPSSPYGSYVLVYDRNTYQISGIGFDMRGMPTDEGITSGTANVTINFSNYSTDAISPEVFWEDRFIYKDAGELYLKPTFASYQFLDNTTSKPQSELPQ